MKIELVNEQNYSMLVEWWKEHNWGIVPFSMLPKIGFIVDGTVAGFIYSTDSQVCLIEWIISDPKSEKLKRKKCLDYLLSVLCETAKDMGFKMGYTYTKNKGLIENLEKNGFQQTDTDVVHFIRRL
jgi:hypothetical protein